MKKIMSTGQSFHQGWNGFQATFDERPGMESCFTYDYWIDSTEVTQEQYYKVMGRRPVDTGSSYGVGDNFPVYYVSWFDAVLYCNARSRREGFDTVYSYSGIKKLPNGGVFELTGIRSDLTRNGYRLPTEAEWEYAANGGASIMPYTSVSDSDYACYYAWYRKNSLYMTHRVATRLPNGFGLYDMAGNVFEWTNDWKCMYTEQNITNPMGAMYPGNEYEKVIKGGAFNYPYMYLRPSCRSATYKTILSSANEYVGFRCARGSVPGGSHIGIGEIPFKPKPVFILSSASELRSFLLTSELKLVFVNVMGPERTLCCVDFSRPFPFVQNFMDDRKVYHPTISPDGQYVAYCTQNEGMTGPSKIRIRNLDSMNTPIEELAPDTAYIPRWWIHPLSGDTGVVYTNSGADNISPLWQSTKTFFQRISGGKAAGPAEVLVSDGSFRDGISVKARYAVSGFRRLMRRDLSTGETKQLFLSPQNGKDALGSKQVCNVSISPDTGNSVRCMFLDFGYPRTSTVTGRSYFQHEYLFVSDMDGNITNYLRCPAGEQSWDGVEWTNRRRFGIGCCRNSVYQAHAVYLIDLMGKTYRQLVAGTELQQPYLRIGLNISNDSLGLYNEPPIFYDQALLATKLLMFWRCFDSLDMVVLGSSHARLGIDTRKFVGFRTLNVAANGCGLHGQKTIILNYLKHCPDIKLICSSMDIGWLYFPKGDITWENGFGQSKGYLFDSSHAFWPEGISDEFTDIIRSVPVPNPGDTVRLGFDSVSAEGWGDSLLPPYCGLPEWNVNDNQDYQENISVINVLADTLRKRGVEWIVINFPTSPHYRNTDFYSYWGPSWQTAQDILQQVRNIESVNPYFHLYDANMDGNHDFGDGDASNYDHLSGVGAEKLSGRLNSLIDSILSK